MPYLGRLDAGSISGGRGGLSARGGTTSCDAEESICVSVTRGKWYLLARVPLAGMLFERLVGLVRLKVQWMALLLLLGRRQVPYILFWSYYSLHRLSLVQGLVDYRQNTRIKRGRTTLPHWATHILSFLPARPLASDERAPSMVTGSRLYVEGRARLRYLRYERAS